MRGRRRGLQARTLVFLAPLSLPSHRRAAYRRTRKRTGDRSERQYQSSGSPVSSSPVIPQKRRLPNRSHSLSVVVSRPLPAISQTPVRTFGQRPAAVAARTSARASGCLLVPASAAARERDSRSVRSVSISSGRPSVNVPVLSKMTMFASANRSKAVPDFTRTPSRSSLPVAIT